MSRQGINNDVKRKLIAESMGRCMNPECNTELYFSGGNIEEKAHIVPCCKTNDNSYENLIILCPNCHTKFDKCHQYTSEELLGWKKKRQEEIKSLFAKRFSKFEDLEKSIKPLLLANKYIYEAYYEGNHKDLWNKFESKIIINNHCIRDILKNNLELFQKTDNPSCSNLHIIEKLILHIDEFESTRIDKEKNRSLLFPSEIYSIFGIKDKPEGLLPMTESLEVLITNLKIENRFIRLEIGLERPFIEILCNNEKECVYLDDAPRLRQFYYNYGCFRKVGVRLKSLNFALKFIRDRGISFSFPNNESIRHINISGKDVLFVYKYCLSKAELVNLGIVSGFIIVNLHNWNGDSCITQDAYALAKQLNVTLLNMDHFYRFVHGFENNYGN